MDRAEKKEFIQSLNGELSKAGMVVVTHYAGLDVQSISKLRNQMREAGAQFRVTKNRLTKRALEGTPYEGISDMFAGPTAIAFSDDLVAPAKIAVEFSKDFESLVVVGGAMGETRLDAEGIKSLASLPSLDELRAKIVGLVQAPAQKIVGVVQAPAGQIARVIGAYATTETA